MLRNYLAAALRNLVRNRLYAVINIIGLAIGFAAALLIGLYVRDELTFDRWIPGFERTYLMSTIGARFDRTVRLDISPSRFAPWMKLDFPEIESIARLRDASVGTRHGDVEGAEKFFWGDPDVFAVLPIPAVVGDLADALRSPDGVAISRSMARKYFGTDTPIGESLEIDRKNVMKVRAVFEDLPADSHLKFDIVGSALASFSTIASLDSQPATDDTSNFFLNVYTYVRLKPGANVAPLRAAMPAFFSRHLPKVSVQFADNSFPLTAIADVHFQPPPSAPVFSIKPRGNLQAVTGIAGVGLLIIAMAVINFVNLMTARAARRAVEVGVRKTSGAQRLQLVCQFIGEALAYVVVAMTFACTLVAILLPAMNAFLQRGIRFDVLHDWSLTMCIVLATTGVAILAGSYPALVLSAFRPAAVLRAGDFRLRDSGVMRNALVIVQFAILIGLGVATGVIARQTNFALRENMRLDADQVLMIYTDCKGAFRDEVSRLSGVRGATCSDTLALNFMELGITATGPDNRSIDLSRAVVAPGFLELYGLAPVAGRFFQEGRAADLFFPQADAVAAERPKAIVINETAVHRLGFASAGEAIGKMLGTSPKSGFQPGGRIGPPLGSLEIIGVVPDFSRDSVNTGIDPTFYYWDPAGFEILSVKLSGREIPETLDAIDRLWKRVGEPKPISRQFLTENIVPYPRPPPPSIAYGSSSGRRA